MFLRFLTAGLVFLTAGTVLAADARPPKLVVAVAVDQFSADLFAEYRGRFTGGFARLQGGAVFPSGYQSHSTTETCPGHATILTGARPGRNGIISNTWADPRAKRSDKIIYCLEDESAPDSSSKVYVVSPRHLKVPTLGDRLKAVDPATRVVSVSGKDRSAVAMAGHTGDEVWWWRGTEFTSYPGRKMPDAVVTANAAAKTLLAAPRPASDLPAVCRAHDAEVVITPKIAVGRGRLARDAGDAMRHIATPDADATVLDLGLAFVKDMKLGQGAATDVLAIGLAATDYVGHRYGPGGAEMCIHLLAVDKLLGAFFDKLDAAGIDYLVVMTADHGGQDVPERTRLHGSPEAERSDRGFTAAKIGRMIGAEFNLDGAVLYGDEYGTGDFWIDAALTDAQRTAVLGRALAFYGAHPQVAAVFTRAQIAAAQIPRTPPDEWSLIERVRASFNPDLSGDFYVALKPRVTSMDKDSQPYTSHHGSPWDYDRRVPIIFWRKGIVGFEQPFAVETVDIMPTLAAMIGLAVPPGDVDGRCLFNCATAH